MAQNVSSSEWGDFIPGGAILSIRLWTSKEDADTEDLFWKSDAPSACLTMDLIRASQGVPVAVRGGILLAHFSGLSAAILAARRIQWAVHGLAEGSDFASTAAAILIDSASDLSVQLQGDSSLMALEQASKGQILLTAESCQSIEDLPGLPLLPTSSSGLRELQWRTAENETDCSADEKTLVQLMQQHGLEDPELGTPEHLPTAKVPVSAPMPVRWAEPVKHLPAPTAADDVIAIRPTGVARLRETPKWLIVTACAIPVLAVIVIVAIVSHKSRPKAPIAQVTHGDAVISAPTVAPNPVPGKTPVAETPHPQKTQDQASSRLPVQPKLQKTKPDNCTLNQTEIGLALNGAEVSFQNRNYSDAERKFRSVLNCSPSNGVALAGLNRAQLAQHTQGASPKP